MYDSIYIGTGIISCLDAVNEKLKGKKVLLVDSAKSIGGAWKSINIFDGNHVENAVHYLLPYTGGYEYISNILGIKLLPEAEKKFFALPLYYSLCHVKNPLAKFIYSIYSNDKLSRLNIFMHLGYCIGNQKIGKSRYPEGGSESLISTALRLISENNVPIRFNFNALDIQVNEGQVKVISNSDCLHSKKIVIGHGFMPQKLTIHSKNIDLDHLYERRPSLHLKFKNNKRFHRDFNQIIFPKGHFIKYIHNLSKAEGADNNVSTIYVMALKHDLVNGVKTKQHVVEILSKYRLVPSSYSIDDFQFFWQDIHLPIITSQQLGQLEELSHSHIKTLKTEDMCWAISHYSKQWNYLNKYLNSLN